MESQAFCAPIEAQEVACGIGIHRHTADEMKIHSFEADHSPSHANQTMNLAVLFVRERALFMFPQNKGASITTGDSRH